MGFRLGIIGLPKRRQVGALQRLDGERGGGGLEPAILDHRRQYRPDRRSRPEARDHRGDRQIGQDGGDPDRFVDIAGLVRGASRGEGLGNRFLAHLREVDAIAEVMRCFESDEVAHVEAGVDPLRDSGIVEAELMLADLESVERRIEPLVKKARGGDKEAAATVALLERARKALAEGRPVRTLEMDSDDKVRFRPAPAYHHQADPLRLQRRRGLGRDRECLFRQGFGPRRSRRGVRGRRLGGDRGRYRPARRGGRARRLPRLHRARGERARPRHSNRLCASGAGDLLHRGAQGGARLDHRSRRHRARGRRQDPQRSGAGFIAAETIPYDDFIASGGEQGAKDAGKMRLEGRDYVVRDGDVILFRFNV